MESILSSIESSSEEILEDVLSNNANINNDINESPFVSFTNALRQFVLTDDTSATTASSAATAISSSNNSKNDTAKWLYNTCSKLPTPLPPLQFTIETLSAIQSGLSDESKMQSTLFELFGEGEKSIEILFEIIAKADKIRKNVTIDLLKSIAECVDGGDAATNGNGGSSSTQQQHDRLYQLRSDAYEATNLAVAIRTEHHQQHNSGYTSRGTHSITRKSDKEAEKTYKRIIKQAITAVNAARDAGALTESDELFLVSQLPSLANNNNNSGHNTNGNNNRGGMEQMLRNEEALLYNNSHTRGLDGMSSEQIQSMKYNLAPEGTKQYNDSSTRGLPKGTERIYKEHYEKVIIPAPIREKSLLRSRINLDEVLGEGTDERLAFGGVKSLNPMQSTVFDSAYRSRENLLICAPTGKLHINYVVF